jgi:hypothetical protein
MIADVAVSSHANASSRLVSPVVSVSASKRAAGTIQSGDLIQGHRGVSYDAATEISSYPRNEDEYEMRPDKKGKPTMKLPAASSTCGAARQELGRVAMRHFCDWLWCLRV